MSKTETALIAETRADRFVKILAAALLHTTAPGDGLETLETLKIETSVDARHPIVWATDRFTAIALTVDATLYSTDPWTFVMRRVDAEEIIAGYKRVGRQGMLALESDGEGAVHVSVTGSSARFKVSGAEYEFPPITRLWASADALRATPGVATALDDRYIEKFRKSRVSASDRLVAYFREDDERGTKPVQVMVGEYGVGLVMPFRSDGRNDAMGVIGL